MGACGESGQVMLLELPAAVALEGLESPCPSHVAEAPSPTRCCGCPLFELLFKSFQVCLSPFKSFFLSDLMYIVISLIACEYIIRARRFKLYPVHERRHSGVHLGHLLDGQTGGREVHVHASHLLWHLDAHEALLKER